VLEAMASGRAVIATRVGGNPEILPDGVAGRLVAPGDPDAIAAAILAYADAPELIRAHGEGGRAHALKNFGMAAMVGNYDRIYRSLL
jgi:glycosyltransferase involved in cell wall biosynthesis